MVAHLPITVGFIGILVGVQIINAMMGYRLNVLGIWPRKPLGWIGIPFSPFLHGNFTHLIFNAVPLFIFSNFILLQGEMVFWHTSILIILLSGILTWALGRNGVHVGASSLIMGYLGFILIGIYHKPTVLSVIIGVTCLFYFSGMLSNLFPSEDKRVSWEGHVFGFIAGITVAFI
ncbi:MAG: hypothetical protein A3C44_02615 [Gammaproteobacteria bacterium RIFCSPHIGHO2_02_FULL_39_13]|nr:MAG: hypothetical protein A3C44_02615 [Gammaproteobacteria bacterium RIFCSPHIGHO2_02_FULL_39_13]OGT50191.1 MAG: hypothetical protein A3E53_01920 [Gammaproteobacteria bacterium RIFCSPHIGHO2_12_FULL_39_24]